MEAPSHPENTTIRKTQNTPESTNTGSTPDKKKTFSQRLKALFKNQVFRYTLLFLCGMILLYLFSMFGGMLTSPGFTYAEF